MTPYTKDMNIPQPWMHYLQSISARLDKTNYLLEQLGKNNHYTLEMDTQTFVGIQKELD